MDMKELVLQGERHCRAGEWRQAVACLERALLDASASSDDCDAAARAFGPVFGQLGVAYFFLGDLTRAIAAHGEEATLNARANNAEAEAKAREGLGNAYKHAARHDEAIAAFERQLDLATTLENKALEGRAYYNLGNAYHAKGKHAAAMRADGSSFDPGQYPASVTEALSKAVDYYDANLTLVTALGDAAAQGRACGNLGNTHYLLGNFSEAIRYHEMRRDLARGFNDKAAERRACTNLANAHIFIGEFDAAAKYYKDTLNIALETNEKAVEAQACYSLGNTYTLLKEYRKAIDYHMMHLEIATVLKDRVGEARACWSLGNAYTAVGEYDVAVYYARQHHKLAHEVGDWKGVAVAKQNLLDLASASKKVSRSSKHDENDGSRTVPTKKKPSLVSTGRVRSLSDTKENREMAEINASKRLVECPARRAHLGEVAVPQRAVSSSPRFFVKDQRSSTKESDHSRSSSSSPMESLRRFLNRPPPPVETAEPAKAKQDGEITESFLDLVSRCQGNRLNQQRCDWPLVASPPPVLASAGNGVLGVAPLVVAPLGDGLNDDFLDAILRLQDSRFEDQRCVLPDAPTIGEDFFNLIVQLQSSRLDEQRSLMPPT